MKVEDLEAIEMRATKATPGPWRWSDWNLTFGQTEDDDWSKRRWLEVHDAGDSPRKHERSVETTLILTVEDPIEHAGDRAFIAHARSDITLLLAEVRRLRTALNRIDTEDTSDVNTLKDIASNALRA